MYSGSIPDVASNSPSSFAATPRPPCWSRAVALLTQANRTLSQGFEMADFANARRKMVDNQLRTSNITDRRLLTAMGEVPRENFVRDNRRMLAYADIAQPLSGGRAMPAPAPFAKLVQLAEVGHTDTVLVVGAATGYGSAVLSRLAAHVTALESDASLAATARDALSAADASNVDVVIGALDGSVELDSQFDVILIEGAVRSEPAAYFPALAEGGRLVVLLQSGAAATAQVYVRSGDDVASRSEFNTSLPPLPARQIETFVF